MQDMTVRQEKKRTTESVKARRNPPSVTSPHHTTNGMTNFGSTTMLPPVNAFHYTSTTGTTANGSGGIPIKQQPPSTLPQHPVPRPPVPQLLPPTNNGSTSTNTGNTNNQSPFGAFNGSSNVSSSSTTSVPNDSRSNHQNPPNCTSDPPSKATNNMTPSGVHQDDKGHGPGASEEEKKVVSLKK